MMKWAPSSPEKSTASSVRFTASCPRRVVGRHEPALAEARVEVEARRHAVDVVPAERVEHLVEVVLVQLLRVVELVAVDEVAQAVDRAPTRSAVVSPAHCGW